MTALRVASVGVILIGQEGTMASKKHKDSRQHQGSVTRRGFLGVVGAGAAAATAGTLDAKAQPAAVIKSGEMVPVTLSVNGREHKLMVEPRWSLIFVLRDTLGLTASKVGCGRGECGACTVLMNDEPRYACMTLAVEASGSKITTPEGLMTGEELGSVQKAFAEHDAFQCGYCTPGQVMAAEGLLRANPDPSIQDIRREMSGNLCRCGAYAHIFQAVKKAGEMKRAKGGQS
jgi:xanthine dehydrogenase YagT iron-sulfur-binding subunit